MAKTGLLPKKLRWVVWTPETHVKFVTERIAKAFAKHLAQQESQDQPYYVMTQSMKSFHDDRRSIMTVKRRVFAKLP